MIRPFEPRREPAQRVVEAADEALLGHHLSVITPRASADYSRLSRRFLLSTLSKTLPASNQRIADLLTGRSA